MSDVVFAPSGATIPFVMLQKPLLDADQFSSLSTLAKVVYACMLDRRSLSLAKGWKDANGEVFIYYTREEVMTLCKCRVDKATAIMAELDEKTGIGLIKRVRQGLCKPSRIYVRDIVDIPASSSTDATDTVSKTPQTPVNTGRRFFRPLDVGFSDTNNTDISDTDSRGVLSINPTQPARENEEKTAHEDDEIRIEKNEKDTQVSHTDNIPSPKQSIQQVCALMLNHAEAARQDAETTQALVVPPNASSYQPARPQVIPLSTMALRKQMWDTYRERIGQNIGYETFIERDDLPLGGMRLVDELFEIMVDVVCSTKPTIRVNREDVPTSVVQGRFLKIRAEHIQYVINSIQENALAIHNIRSYLITALYNSVATLEQKKSADDAHDRRLFIERFGHPSKAQGASQRSVCQWSPEYYEDLTVNSL